MANNEHTGNDPEKQESGDLDRSLDAALAKYASAEPRAGLEERILANLRAADAAAKHRSWWTWGFAALAAVILVAGMIAWRSARPVHPPIATHPSTTQQAPARPEWANRERTAPQKKLAARRVTRHHPRQETVAANPKLEVFPSPLPLSEQERLLEIYVSNNPEHAALLAEARMSDLRQEAEARTAILTRERNLKQ
jgi:hypothetical protein